MTAVPHVKVLILLYRFPGPVPDVNGSFVR